MVRFILCFLLTAFAADAAQSFLPHRRQAWRKGGVPDPCNNPLFDTMTHTNSGTSVPGLTNAITIGANANRVLYIFVGTDASTDINPTVNLSGSSGTQIAEVVGSAGSQDLTVFRIIAPASGAGEIRAQWTSNPGVVVAVAYHTIDQTTPNDAITTGSGSGTSADDNIASAVDDFVLAFLNVDGNTTLTPDSGDCSRVTQISGTAFAYGLSEEDGQASVDIGWTWSGTQKFGSAAFNVNKASAGTVSFVQGNRTFNDNSGVGQSLVTNLTGVAIGNAIVIGVGWEGGGDMLTVTESGGTGSASTWTAETINVHDAGTEPSVRFFWTASAQMSGNVIYTISGDSSTSFKRCHIAEVDYSGGTFQKDVMDHDNEGNSSGTLTSGAITTTGGSGATIVFGFVKGFTALTLTSEQIGGSAATLVAADNSDSAMWYRITTLSSGTATISADASDRWCLPIIAFKVQ